MRSLVHSDCETSRRFISSSSVGALLRLCWLIVPLSRTIYLGNLTWSEHAPNTRPHHTYILHNKMQILDTVKWQNILVTYVSMISWPMEHLSSSLLTQKLKEIFNGILVQWSTFNPPQSNILFLISNANDNLASKPETYYLIIWTWPSPISISVAPTSGRQTNEEP